MRIKKQKNYSILGKIKPELDRIMTENRRKGKVYGNLAKKSITDPGYVVRRFVSGAQKNPLKTTIDVAATSSPVPGTRIAMIAGNKAIENATRKITGQKNLKKLRKISKETLVGEKGDKIQKTVNDAYYKGINFATNLSRMLPV